MTSLTAAPPASAGRALAVRLLATVLGLVFGLVVAELGVRLFTIVGGPSGARLASRDPLGAIYEPYGSFGYRPVPGKTERFPNATAAHYNRMAYRGPEVPVEKPAGVYRIVLLGGSTAVGYGVNDDQTIDAYMRTQLKAAYPGRCIQVVNLGLGGYDSYQDYERLLVDGMPRHPDLVIIHSGINDVRNAQFANLTAPPDQRTLIWEGPLQLMREVKAKGPGVWVLLKHWFYLPRLPGFIRELTSQQKTLGVIRVVEPHDDAQRYFEQNVTATIDMALKDSMAIILSKPPSGIPIRNKPTDPVEKSYWIKDAGTTEAYRDRLGNSMAALAQRYASTGARITYVTHTLPLDQYIDDAHLAASGNETVARGLVAAIAPMLAAHDSTAGHPSACE